MTADERLALINLKIERAKKHIIDLNAEIQGFLKSNPYEVAAKHDPKTGDLIFYVTRVDQTPVAISIIAGEVIQHIRSALDHLAYQLFMVGTRGNSGPGFHVYFLIERNSKEFEARLPRKVEGMRQDAINAIRSIEPYKGGKGHEFWVLNELNNIDKHRLIVTIGIALRTRIGAGLLLADTIRALGIKVQVSEDQIRQMNTMMGLQITRHKPLQTGDKLFVIPSKLIHEVKPHENFNFGFEIAFSEPDIAQGRPVIETLQHFTDLVSNTVALFKACLA
jgi:hypothetical protein